MRYALNLAQDGRILSATFEKYAVQGQPLTPSLPDGNIADYLCMNGEYIYDPLPEPETKETVTISAEELNVLRAKAEGYDILMEGVPT